MDFCSKLWISVRNYFNLLFCYNSIIFDWFWLKPLINYFVKFSLATAWSSADIGRTPECCSTPVDFKRPDDYETCSCLYDLNLSLVIFKYSRSAFFCFCLSQTVSTDSVYTKIVSLLLVSNLIGYYDYFSQVGSFYSGF